VSKHRDTSTLPLPGLEEDPPLRLPPTPAQWVMAMTALAAIAAGPDQTREWAKTHDIGREHWATSRHNVWSREMLARAVASAALGSANDAVEGGKQ